MTDESERPVDLVVMLVEPAAEPEPPVVNSPMQRMVEPGEPWNVMNTLAGHAEAMNRYAKIKMEYDENFAQDVPAPQAAPAPAPRISPISAGMRIDPDPEKYVIDRDVAARVERWR